MQTEWMVCIVVTTVGLEVGQPGLKPWPHEVKAVSPSMSYLASLHLSFLLENVNDNSTCLIGLV